MAIYELDQTRPTVHPNAWVADSADVIGNVHLHDNSSVWFGAVLRGDNEPITLGAGSNVQDLSMLHSDLGCPLSIGENVTVGHQVTLHGCTVGDNSLIGMGATVLNRARIGKNCIVGAGSLVTEGKEFPDNSMIMGSPAKLVRVLDDDAAAKLRQSALMYQANAKRFAGGLLKIA